ncbi:acyltransferase family protein, partial [Rubripirellula sp.]
SERSDLIASVRPCNNRIPKMSSSRAQPASTITTITRRHDLDALRAIAMLLGIVLHSAFSFAPIPWIVRDSQQSEFFYYLVSFIHGFRMPLFFLISGFFHRNAMAQTWTSCSFQTT